MSLQEQEFIAEQYMNEAIVLQHDIIDILIREKKRLDMGLPPLVTAAQLTYYQNALQHYQQIIDEPFTDEEHDITFAEPYPESGSIFAPWSAAEHYLVGDRVTHNGFLWIATSNSINNEPDDVPGDWEKIE